MRPLLCLILILAAAPLKAWDFSSLPVCTLRDPGPPEVKITYDGTLYALHLTRSGGWPDAPIFEIRFDGAVSFTITTNRHLIDGDVLTVTDSGFGNVLNGLQFNHTATALVGDLALPLDLDGAAAAVQAFRECPGTPSA